LGEKARYWRCFFSGLGERKLIACSFTQSSGQLSDKDKTMNLSKLKKMFVYAVVMIALAAIAVVSASGQEQKMTPEQAFAAYGAKSPTEAKVVEQGGKMRVSYTAGSYPGDGARLFYLQTNTVALEHGEFLQVNLVARQKFPRPCTSTGGFFIPATAAVTTPLGESHISISKAGIADISPAWVLVRKYRFTRPRLPMIIRAANIRLTY
jgi:hypothetical protein